MGSKGNQIFSQTASEYDMVWYLRIKC